MPVRMSGATSGYVELAAPAVAGTTVLELPTDSIKPGLVLVAASTFTAASSVSVDDCFSGAYENYLVVFSIDAPSVGNSVLAMRMRAGGVANTAASYSYASDGINESNVAQNFYASGGTAFQATRTAVNAQPTSFSYTFTRPYLSKPTQVFGSTVNGGTTNVNTSSNFGGTHAVSSPFDGLTVYPASGTITGSLSVYGYRKAL